MACSWCVRKANLLGLSPGREELRNNFKRVERLKQQDKYKGEV